KRYEKYIKKMGIGDRIFIDGWHDHDEYVKILDKNHVFVVPSVTAGDNDQEGIPNVVKEAMAMGLISIATVHSGNSELIENNISGFLIPERNSKALAKTIDSVLKHHDKWSAMQLIARDVVCKKFDTEKLNDTLEKIFLKLIST